MVDQAHATPNNNWDVAPAPNTATVIVNDPGTSGHTHNGVEIVLFEMTGSSGMDYITVHKNQFPHGVIILNEEPRPANTDTICTALKDSLTCEVVPSPIQEKQVNVPHNNGFPCGRIIIWWP